MKHIIPEKQDMHFHFKFALRRQFSLVNEIRWRKDYIEKNPSSCLSADYRKLLAELEGENIALLQCIADMERDYKSFQFRKMMAEIIILFAICDIFLGATLYGSALFQISAISVWTWLSSAFFFIVGMRKLRRNKKNYKNLSYNF